MATGRTDERLAAALGLLPAAPIRFEAAQDVPNGGVLCALPALLAFGLLRHTSGSFTLPKGFYPLSSIFLSVAFLALGRVKSLEVLRYHSPGEWGKLLGLDRIPEVKTLRSKLAHLAADTSGVYDWSTQMGKDWMAQSPVSAGTLYVDGHVRVYHGELTELPRRYVSRQRLCLRATTDYWVNAMDGQPFFVVTRAVDPGLSKVLREQIVPRLLSEVPGQPAQSALAADRLLSRFALVFDREGYSPELFGWLREQRVAVLTYHKFADKDWSQEEFENRTVRLINGEDVSLDLAERGTRLSNGLWVREIRHRDSKGYQTSVLTTDYRREITQAAGAMFARWCQENFFKYMQQHYALDHLVEHGTEPLPETVRVVNPAWRELNGKVNRLRGPLLRLHAQFGAASVPMEGTPEEVSAHEREQGEVLRTVQERASEMAALKEQRGQTPKHVNLSELPLEQRFTQLRLARKQLVDTIKMTAYRAETALVQIVREKLARGDDARAWVRGLMNGMADLQPDLEKGTLTVWLHPQTCQAHETVLEHVCEELTATETEFPETSLRMVFKPLAPSKTRSTQIPPGQDV